MPELKLENSIVDDRFFVERSLGRGSYAEVFLAYDQARNNLPVIIKALNTSLQGTPDIELERTLVENFQNEAIALDKVRHPNIIRRLGHGTAADLRGTPFHYLLLEYMPGGDLLSLCTKRPFGIGDAVYYFKQVAEALAHAHSQHVIHRDIKPNNLLLSADHSIIKIADFGVAKMILDDSREITRVGTNVYAPPEHHPDSPSADFEERLTPSADIYSLAKTIYTAMTGRAPRQFARQQITWLPAELSEQAWGEALLSVLRRATATRVADRYQTVQQFWEEFARAETLALREGAAGEEIDSEATIVRSRLGGASPVAQPASVPNFQTLANAPYESKHPRKARIVVDLPQRPQPEPVAAYSEPNSSARRNQQSYAPASATVAQQAREEGAAQPALRARKPAAIESAQASFFDSLRSVVGSEWLRRIFILFLVAALIGLFASTYYYFADKRRRVPSITFPFSQPEGSIAGVANVNLRSEPWGDVLAVLPMGTRVRVIENRDRWTRVKVVEWAGTPPSDAPDDGWVDGRYVRLDQR